MDTPAGYALVPVADLQRLSDQVDRLTRMVEGATITPAPTWHTISDAARKLGVDPSTIHRKIDRGELKAKGAGRTRRVMIDPD